MGDVAAPIHEHADLTPNFVAQLGELPRELLGDQTIGGEPAPSEALEALLLAGPQALGVSVDADCWDSWGYPMAPAGCIEAATATGPSTGGPTNLRDAEFPGKVKGESRRIRNVSGISTQNVAIRPQFNQAHRTRGGNFHLQARVAPRLLVFGTSRRVLRSKQEGPCSIVLAP